MKEKVFIRLYDFCIEDDRKPPYPRGYIFRKNRVLAGLSFLFFHLAMLVLIVLFHDSNRLQIIAVLLSSLLILSFTRMDPFSLYSLIRLKSLSRKSNRSILEEFILETNYEKNNITFHQENCIGFKVHFSWLKSTLVFRDKRLHNIHLFTVSLRGVKYKCKLSKKCIQTVKHMKVNSICMSGFFDRDHFKTCLNLKEFQNEVLQLYLEKRDAMNRIIASD